MIEVQNITKRYGSVEAVKDVSFTVGTDQVLGFLGPNGAGKTTVMKILTGFHFPSSGRAAVDGFSVEDDPVEVKKRTGYLPESVPLYGDMTVEEYLSFMAAARLIPPEKRKQAVGESVVSCGLVPMRKRLIDTLSKGYRQRLGLAQAIIHDPPVLILDEPTSGLDPNQIIEIRSLIKNLGKRKTVILSTHILQEVEAVCSQVLILNAGRIAAQGKPEEIGGKLKGGDTWDLVLKCPAGIRDSAGGASGLEAKAARLVPGLVPDIRERDGLFEMSFFLPPERSENGMGERIFDWAVAEGLKILSMNRRKLSLEDIFVQLTENQPGENRPGGFSEAPAAKEGEA
ncbi:MAG: ATP-binding cassette domain-containing protein [Treponema sp.]|jgi:ABC-2 type transport system ATP-binding protein|nr:ATP-binding cassette domain-containing protein [Treponema sp.]